MSHEFETGFFVSQPAWHELGTVLREAPSIDEAIVAAGLDWNVRLEDLQIASDGRAVTHRATVRDSDNSILGVVGPSFVPLQNKDAFAWFQPLIDSGEVQLEAAGSLRAGRRVWVLGKVASETEIVPGDVVRQYVLLAHGHDGSLAIRLGFTSVRVVCANTLRASMDADKETLVKINHLKGAEAALKRVRAAMDLAGRKFKYNADQMRQLARCGCTIDQVKWYAREVFAGEGEGTNERAVPRVVARVVELFDGAGRGIDLPGVRGTVWGAYNAITEITTHHKGRTADARVDSAWFGENGRLANRALDVGLKLAA